MAKQSIVVKLDAKTKDALSALAAQDMRSRANLIEKILVEYVQRNSKPAAPDNHPIHHEDI